MSSKVVRGICLVGVTLGLASCCNVFQQEAERQTQMKAAEAREAKEARLKAEAQGQEQQRKIEALLGQLSSAKDEATRLALQKQLEVEKSKLEKLKPGGYGTKAPAPAKPCNCTPGDPLCSCL
jgi:colicin import membrane protein